jgi:hypothetical protein
MLEVDPLVLGNVRETFARFIRKGETALLVSAETAQFATDIMPLYAPSCKRAGGIRRSACAHRRTDRTRELPERPRLPRPL